MRLSLDRRRTLEDRLHLYVFEREAKELQTWLTSKKTAAESEDCGQDLEDVEVTSLSGEMARTWRMWFRPTLWSSSGPTQPPTVVTKLFHLMVLKLSSSLAGPH